MRQIKLPYWNIDGNHRAHPEALSLMVNTLSKFIKIKHWFDIDNEINMLIGVKHQGNGLLNKKKQLTKWIEMR